MYKIGIIKKLNLFLTCNKCIWNCFVHETCKSLKLHYKQFQG